MARLKRSKKIIFSVLLLVLALLLLEMTLRLGGVLYLHFRYPAKPAIADSNSFNILCLGDSFTQGFGAPKGKSYPEQLQELMKGQTDKNVTVYKESRINSSTVLKHLERDIHTYDPDLIIIMTGCNDRWSMENAGDSAFGDGDLLGKIDIALSGFKVYKLIKISRFNLQVLITEKDPRFIEEGSIERALMNFSVPEAERHFSLGEYAMYKGEYEEALREFNIAEGLEPQNPWVHWRKACIYIQAMHEPALGESELKLTLWHGDSSVIEYAFMLLPQLYGVDNNKTQAMIREMDNIINAKYNEKDKAKAKRNLKRLASLRDDQRVLERVVAFNLAEITKIAKKKNIKIILMHYPAGVAPYARAVTKKSAELFGVPVVDNRKIFEDKLKVLKREELFVADGHCNARGNGLIAENLYRVLTQERMFDGAGSGRT